MPISCKLFVRQPNLLTLATENRSTEGMEWNGLDWIGLACNHFVYYGCMDAVFGH